MLTRTPCFRNTYKLKVAKNLTNMSKFFESVLYPNKVLKKTYHHSKKI